MRIVYKRCCGMDVHKDSVTACVLRIDEDGEFEKQTRYFSTMTRDLKEMSGWLASLGVEAIAIAYASHCTSLGRCAIAAPVAEHQQVTGERIAANHVLRHHREPIEGAPHIARYGAEIDFDRCRETQHP